MLSLSRLHLTTLLGVIRIEGHEHGVSSIAFIDQSEADDREVPVSLRECREQLTQYFASARRDFTSLPLALEGTDFQARTWNQLLKVPFGETLTYGDVADAMGSPGAARAVGTALGRNPIAIIVPCHRIVASSGSGGYAWGKERKEWLLKHEASLRQQP